MKKEITEMSPEERLIRAIFGERKGEPLGENDERVVPEKLPANLKVKLAEVLQSLGNRERKVLEMRFGLADGHEQNLEAVSKQFKVTRERIRQIENKALRKMRHPTRSRPLQQALS